MKRFGPRVSPCDHRISASRHDPASALTVTDRGNRRLPGCYGVSGVQVPSEFHTCNRTSDLPTTLKSPHHQHRIYGLHDRLGSRVESGRQFFLYASITASPSPPALRSHSAVSCSPTCFRPVIRTSPGGTTFNPFSVSCSMYQRFISSDALQPRASAAAAALISATFVGLSRRSNIVLLTKAMFFGIDARAS